MKAAVEEWIAASREKMRSGSLEAADLDQLEALLAEPRQLVLYLNSRSSNMRSGISNWVLYDSTQPHEPALPTQGLPWLGPGSRGRRLAHRAVSDFQVVLLPGHG